MALSARAKALSVQLADAVPRGVRASSLAPRFSSVSTLLEIRLVVRLRFAGRRVTLSVVGRHRCDALLRRP